MQKNIVGKNIMISINRLFLAEGVWDRFRNSISNILGRRQQTRVVPPPSISVNKIVQGLEASKKRVVTPKPDTLGFKPPRIFKSS